MYWYGHIAIEPSQLAEVRRKPTKGFKRIAELLTVGILSQREQVETFTAISILQDINVVMRSLGITDLVRLSKDEQSLYDDSEGQFDNDLEPAIEQLQSNSTLRNGTVFETLTMMLEHHLEELALVIEVRIRRVHDVGICPIQIVVNGLAASMRGSGDLAANASVVTDTFASQENYDAFANKHREQFDAFMSRLELAIRQKMSIQDLHKSVRTKVVRPDSVSATAIQSKRNTTTDSDPVFDRYDSTSDMFFYCWLWSSFSHDHGIHIADTTLVDGSGHDMLTINELGIDAGEASLLDPQVPIAEVDASSWDSAAGVDSDSSKGWFGGDTSSDSSGGGWLDSFGFGDSDGGGGSDGGSSCGSSCGSGCGGD
jgi:hypothetical protein